MSKLAAFRRGVGQFEPAFQGKRSSLGDLFGWRKTRHILLSFSEDCVILRSVVLTQYRRVVIVIVIPACDRRTDRRTDGIAVARLVQSLLAMRALRRAATTPLCLTVFRWATPVIRRRIVCLLL